MASSGTLILYVLLESTPASSFAPRGGTLLRRDLRIAWFCTPCLITLDIWLGLLKDLMMASSGMFELLRDLIIASVGMLELLKDLIIASSGIPPKLLFVRPINLVDRCAPSTFSRASSFSTFSTFLLQSKTFSRLFSFASSISSAEL